MWDDVTFAPCGYYGAIFEPETGEIIDCEPKQDSHDIMNNSQ